ncbi:MAG: hypothetical protein H7A33_06795 [Deltaproteobacteria bacterium]|nr:hypothetical protein [Deltaproteobacteria bacterium]
MLQGNFYGPEGSHKSFKKNLLAFDSRKSSALCIKSMLNQMAMESLGCWFWKDIENKVGQVDGSKRFFDLVNSIFRTRFRKERFAWLVHLTKQFSEIENKETIYALQSLQKQGLLRSVPSLLSKKRKGGFFSLPSLPPLPRLVRGAQLYGWKGYDDIEANAWNTKTELLVSGAEYLYGDASEFLAWASKLLNLMTELSKHLR